jgi:hypothetical protein
VILLHEAGLGYGLGTRKNGLYTFRSFDVYDASSVCVYVELIIGVLNKVLIYNSIDVVVSNT